MRARFRVTEIAQDERATASACLGIALHIIKPIHVRLASPLERVPVDGQPTDVGAPCRKTESGTRARPCHELFRFETLKNGGETHRTAQSLGQAVEIDRCTNLKPLAHRPPYRA